MRSEAGRKALGEALELLKSRNHGQPYLPGLAPLRAYFTPSRRFSDDEDLAELEDLYQYVDLELSGGRRRPNPDADPGDRDPGDRDPGDLVD